MFDNAPESAAGRLRMDTAAVEAAAARRDRSKLLAEASIKEIVLELSTRGEPMLLSIKCGAELLMQFSGRITDQIHLYQAMQREFVLSATKHIANDIVANANTPPPCRRRCEDWRALGVRAA